MGCLPGFLRATKGLPWCPGEGKAEVRTPDLLAPRGGAVSWSRLRAQPEGGALRTRGWAHAHGPAPSGQRSQPRPLSGSRPPWTGGSGPSKSRDGPAPRHSGWSPPSTKQRDDTHWLCLFVVCSLCTPVISPGCDLSPGPIPWWLCLLPPPLPGRPHPRDR